jgi:hypothetical protein
MFLNHSHSHMVATLRPGVGAHRRPSPGAVLRRFATLLRRTIRNTAIKPNCTRRQSRDNNKSHHWPSSDREPITRGCIILARDSRFPRCFLPCTEGVGEGGLAAIRGGPFHGLRNRFIGFGKVLTMRINWVFDFSSSILSRMRCADALESTVVDHCPGLSERPQARSELLGPRLACRESRDCICPRALSYKLLARGTSFKLSSCARARSRSFDRGGEHKRSPQSGRTITTVPERSAPDALPLASTSLPCVSSCSSRNAMREGRI